MLKQIKQVKSMVQNALQLWPQTRDNDKLLWLSIMVNDFRLRDELGEHSYQIFKLWLLKNNVPTFESITRVRRKFQEAGQFVGTKRDKRLDEESVVRDFFRE